MKKINAIVLRITLIIGTLGMATSLFSQKLSDENGPCQFKVTKRASYDVVYEHKRTIPSNILMIDIAVKRKNFNEDFMINLARTLTARYCRETVVSIAIFDDKRVARRTDLAEYSLGRIKEPALRGFYTFDRSAKLIQLTFSSIRGESPNEIKIDIPYDK